MRSVPSLLCLLIPALLQGAVVPNPRVSAGTADTSSSPPYATELLTDGKFGSSWNFKAGAWAALKLEAGPSRILLTWNDASGNWSDKLPFEGVCKAGTTYPSAYKLMTSANSTDGVDGTWDTLVRVTGNVVAARAHVLDFAGRSWVKMAIDSGSGKLDEIEVYDATNGSDDSWFFLGTSITMMTFKSTVPDSTFSEMVHARLPAQTPSLVRGGVPCINSRQVLAAITPYLDNIAGSHYVAIEMGTNDAWGGGDWNLFNFTDNMQAIIDSVKARGLEPILARVIATDSARAGWQVDPGYPQAIDALTKKNGLIAGPDLDAWFRAHPEELADDGVHPSATAAMSIQRLWAEAMVKNLYSTQGTSSLPSRPRLTKLRLTTGTDAMGRPALGKANGIRLNQNGAKLDGPKPSR